MTPDATPQPTQLPNAINAVQTPRGRVFSLPPLRASPSHPTRLPTAILLIPQAPDSTISLKPWSDLNPLTNTPFRGPVPTQHSTDVVAWPPGPSVWSPAPSPMASSSGTPVPLQVVAEQAPGACARASPLGLLYTLWANEETCPGPLVKSRCPFPNPTSLK